MSTLLIIKTGSTLSSLRARRGDFEDWILAGMGLRREQVSIVDVEKGEHLPAYEEVHAVVITGSHAMVTEHHPWSEDTAAWLVPAIERRIPVLGICYGHQLLAYALGSEVGYNLHGLEAGTVDVRLTSAASQDQLLGGLPNPLPLQVSHAQSVLRLPEGAKLLASSPLNPYHAFIFNDFTWGVQFHPEFDADITRTYIQADRLELEKAGRKADHLSYACFDTPYGTQILQRFSHLAAHGAP